MGALIYICGALSVINAGFSIWHLIGDRWDRATYHLVVTIWMWYIVTIM